MRQLAAILTVLRLSLRFASHAHAIRRLALLTALAGLGACGSDSSTSPPPEVIAIAGTYSLRTVNGSALPFTIQSGGNSLSLTSDIITIASNGSWTESINFSETVDGQTTSGTEVDGGTWVRAGSSLTLQSSVNGGIAYSGAVSNGSLTFNAAGFVVVFSR